MRASVGIGNDRPFEELVERALWAESLGFETAWLPDHLLNPYRPEAAWLDPWTVLPALSQRVRTIRLGTMVTCMTIRQPALLARQAITVDQLSGGRLDLAVGAAGAKIDHQILGIPYWEPPERMDRFREFVELLGRLLLGDVAPYEGTHFRCSGMEMAPGPVQSPRPPLVVSAQANPSVRVAAAFADRFVTFAGYPTPSRTPEKNTLAFAVEAAAGRLRVLDEACGATGRDPAEIRRTISLLGVASAQGLESAQAMVDVAGAFYEVGYDDVVVPTRAADGADLFDPAHRHRFEQLFGEAAAHL